MEQKDVLGEMLDAGADRLAAYGYLLTGSQHAGEDLVQDAIVKVFVKKRRLDNPRAAEGYVRATMRTIHIDGIRRQGRFRALMPRLAHADAVDSADVAVMDRARMGVALKALAPQERAVVVLRFYDDLKVSDIAAHMHLAEGTVKRYLSQALDRLAHELGDIDGDADRIGVVERKK
ncbi:sigma-70 family RNA polymerase sigma factor [Demequina sp. TTPB684]|uniref:RNA polymerase sigma factor n=1 Tax=unclassified Demequina TaxID=2620311 RepID=UPI001CF3426B|nr:MULTISPECIES: sigma-70 family RNA polymerase sigma factor [unclassified Demequina]MCB2413121.1 sigma-70 family RNA polymerase sigma factor [Demequina sp. TTPB684]UPU87517.1 sigma-70 family RNA polymerase sigma factor [Demequina sp. TMPB413]